MKSKPFLDLAAPNLRTILKQYAVTKTSEVRHKPDFQDFPGLENDFRTFQDMYEACLTRAWFVKVNQLNRNTRNRSKSSND